MMSSLLILKLELASNSVVITLAESSITDASHPCAEEYPGFKISIVDDQHESCGKIWAATERNQNLRMHAWYAILEPHIACCGTSETGVLQILTGRRLGPQANPRGKKKPWPGESKELLGHTQVFVTLPSFQLPTNCKYHYFFCWNSLDCKSLSPSPAFSCLQTAGTTTSSVGTH
jgi:hypothetical protein